MRAYTDLEQSKKLAKILPIESADMHYVMIDTVNEIYSAGLSNYIGILPSLPCWSFAALFSVLPLECGMHKQTDDSLTYYYVEYPCKIKKKYLFSKRHDNPIDACYEMIMRLKELKML